MNKMIVLPLFFLCCTYNISNYYNNKIGFEISTYGYQSTSSATVYINMEDVIDTLPIITINGNQQDTPQVYQHEFAFSNIKLNSIFEYRIICRDDTLQDSLYLPGNIDSLYFNGKYIKTDTMYYLTTFDSFSLKWSDSIKPDYYSLNITSDLISNNYYQAIINDTFVKLELDTTINFPSNRPNGNISIQISKLYSKDFSQNITADKYSRKMYAYYRVFGPVCTYTLAKN